jgi:circadian clock protein KaiC
MFVNPGEAFMSAISIAKGRISTGCEGLDEIANGGLLANRIYLIEGLPGSGKTTLALQFLFGGRARGERGLYITLSETKDELLTIADSHGWSLDGIDVFELASIESALSPDRELTLLHPWEIELGETVKLITEQVEHIKPTRVVFDSLSEMRLLAQDPLRYRRQILALKQYFATHAATVLLLDDRTATADGDLQLHSICHGVIRMERLTLDYGVTRRRLEIQKLRGSAYREGWHDFELRRGGLQVFPRLIAAEHLVAESREQIQSGVAELDALLQGGPTRGTSILVTGPAGAGKTTLAMQYVSAAAERGERCAVYEFDERIATVLSRCDKLGIALRPHIDADRIVLRQVDPASISPGAFAALIRDEIDKQDARIVVIDSLNGYLAAMPQEKELLLQIHELLSYLAQKDIVTFLINPQQGLVGEMQTALNISYVADAVVLLRFFEAAGRIRKAVSVLKNRGGGHEETIREFKIDEGGLRIGEPLTAFHGVLSGTPSYTGAQAPLLDERGANDE